MLSHIELTTGQAIREEVKEDRKKLKLLYTSKQIKKKCKELAVSIAKRLQNTPDIIVLTMLCGGDYFGVMLKKELAKLNLLFKEDYIKVSRYGNQQQGGLPTLEYFPKTSLKGYTVIIIDDVIEEGITLHYGKTECLNAGATEVLTAVMIDKVNQRAESCANMRADFSCYTHTENKFLIGKGLDHKKYLRGLSGIFYKPEQKPTVAVNEAKTKRNCCF